MPGGNRVGGVAALVQAVFFLLIPLVFVFILPSMGLQLSEQGDPTSLLAFSATNPLLMWFDAAIVIASAAIVMLALVLHDQLGKAAPRAMRASLIAAAIGAGFFVASGLTDLHDLAILGHVYVTNAGLATAAYLGVGTLALSLLLPGWAAYGISVGVASQAALMTGRFTPALNYLGIVWGSLAALSVLVFVSQALYVLGLIGPCVGLFWAGWMAWTMLRQDARERAHSRQRSQVSATSTP